MGPDPGDGLELRRELRSLGQQDGKLSHMTGKGFQNKHKVGNPLT